MKKNKKSLQQLCKKKKTTPTIITLRSISIIRKENGVTKTTVSLTDDIEDDINAQLVSNSYF